MRANGTPAVAVATFVDAFRDGTLEKTDRVEQIDHPVTGRRWYLRVPGRVDGVAFDSRRPAPLFAQHTDEVLSEWAGLDEATRSELRRSGAIGTTPRQRSR